MDAIFSFSFGDFALRMFGHAMESTAPVAVVLLINDRREIVMESSRLTLSDVIWGWRVRNVSLVGMAYASRFTFVL